MGTRLVTILMEKWSTRHLPTPSNTWAHLGTPRDTSGNAGHLHAGLLTESATIENGTLFLLDTGSIPSTIYMAASVA